MSDIDGFISGVSSPKRRRDAETLLALMREVTGEDPRLDGTIVAFGSYHYRYASGREGDAPAAAFSPRTAATTVYVMDGVAAHEADLALLGPHTTGVGCIYLKDLEQNDLDALRRIVARSYATRTSGVFGGPAKA